MSGTVIGTGNTKKTYRHNQAPGFQRMILIPVGK